MAVTAAVVSLFNPSRSVLDNAAALLSQTDIVVVVDDGSPHDPSDILAELEAMGCVVKRVATNSGIAEALNTGIAEALSSEIKPDYILTMDQDSLLDPGYVAALVDAAKAATVAGVRVGMVAPATIRGLPTRREGTEHGIALGGEPIQSGLLIPVPVLEDVGLLRSELFIDGVDTEFYLRCRDAGLKAVIAPNAALDHALGSMTQGRILGVPVSIAGKPLAVRTAATWRYYYIFRNRILLAKDYGRRHFLWALKGFLADYRHLAIVSVLASGRRERLAQAFAGVAAGFAGRTGRRQAAP